MDRRRFLIGGLAAAAVGVVGGCGRPESDASPSPSPTSSPSPSQTPFPEILGLTPGLSSTPVAQVTAQVAVEETNLRLHGSGRTFLIEGWWVTAVTTRFGQFMASISASDPHAEAVLVNLSAQRHPQQEIPHSDAAMWQPNHGNAVTVVTLEEDPSASSDDDHRIARATTWAVTAAAGVSAPTEATALLDESFQALTASCFGGDVLVRGDTAAMIFDGVAWKLVEPPPGVPADAWCVNTANSAADQFWVSDSGFSAWIVREGSVVPVEVGISEPGDDVDEETSLRFGRYAVHAGDTGWLVNYRNPAQDLDVAMLVLPDGTRAENQPDTMTHTYTPVCRRSVTSSGLPGRYLSCAGLVVDLAKPRAMTSDGYVNSIVGDIVYGGVPTARRSDDTPAALMSIPQTGVSLQVDDPGEQSWRSAESVGPEFALVTAEGPYSHLYVVPVT